MKYPARKMCVLLIFYSIFSCLICRNVLAVLALNLYGKNNNVQKDTGHYKININNLDFWFGSIGVVIYRCTVVPAIVTIEDHIHTD